MTRLTPENPIRTLCALIAATLAVSALWASAALAATPVWQINSVSNSTVSALGEATVSTFAQGSASPAANEVQRLEITAAAGQFRLAFGPEVTADLPYEPSTGDVQAALESLPSIGAGNISVSGGPFFGGLQQLPYRITFQGALASQDVAQISVGPGATPLSGRLGFHVDVRNIGGVPTNSEVKLTVTLPAGLSLASAGPGGLGGMLECPTANVGDTTFVCSSTSIFEGSPSPQLITVAVDPGATGTKTAHFQLEGGGALEPATTVDPVRISSTPPAFGIDAFDQQAIANAAGAITTQAAAHPYAVLGSVDFNLASEADPAGGDRNPVEPVRDVEVDLPPGLLGYPSAADTCTLEDLARTIPVTVEVRSLCSPESQVGTVDVIYNGGAFVGASVGPLPLFNLVAPPGVAARFGFNVAGSIVVLDADLRSGSDYGVTLVSRYVSEGVPVGGSHLTFWGYPAAEAHDFQRSCPDQPVAGSPGGVACLSKAPEVAFLRLPTACTDPGVGLPIAVRADSWLHPGVFDSRSIVTHDAPGLPYPESEWGAPHGPDGCDKVPFNPSLSVTPTTDAADSPTGLEIGLSLPQGPESAKIDQSDLKKAVITLPQGMAINPAAASGQGACSSAQIGLLGTDFPAPAPIHFTPEAPNCPDSAKIGTVSIETPALDHPIPGAVYLAAQGDNPFGSLLALYLVAEDPASGVVVKLAGKIDADPQSGRLTTSFDNNPQVPFSRLQVKLFGGPRAALRTPPRCGGFAVRGSFTPWSGNAPVAANGAFDLTKGPGGGPCPDPGFDPKLTAGTQNPLAGSYSPFSLRLTRDDGTQELGALQATLPKGLTGKPAGIPYCPEATLAAISGALGTGAAQIASPSCPAASQVGTVTVGAGAGPNPFYTSSGRAYWAGPYKGAPLSLAVVTPAVAGPFDLGSVVVRNALRVDPETTQITAVSDPLPTILYGIPLDLRDVRVNLNRPEFTLNPTSCEPAAITSTITSAQGATANPSSRFQAAACDRLGFKPKLSLKLKGGTKRSNHPALTAVLQAHKGDANIGRVSVALPHSEFLAQSHIRTICTRVQFAGDACPPGSIYGKVTATSPLVDYPLTGNVYLRSSDHPLPDMVLALRGPATQPLEVNAVGRIDSKNGGIRTTFATVPDAPLTKVVLKLPGGKKSLLENSTNLCRATNKATVQMDGQNGKTNDISAPLKVKCPKAGNAKKHRRAG